MRQVKAAVRKIVDRLARDAFLKATRNGEYVVSGPFAGMRYVKYSLSSAWPPKLLGLYEKELHPLLARLSKTQFKTIIDIGAAEGYYAVGMACAHPEAQILAFESDAHGQQLIAELAELNGVKGRVTVGGLCDIERLRHSLRQDPGALIIMDIEGGELDLLNPAEVPELAQCQILVELHDCFKPGLDEEILKRFQHTHNIERIWATPRTPADLTFHVKFFDWYVYRWICESRPPGMSWLYMAPREATGRASATEQTSLPEGRH